MCPVAASRVSGSFRFGASAAEVSGRVSGFVSGLCDLETRRDETRWRSRKGLVRRECAQRFRTHGADASPLCRLSGDHLKLERPKGTRRKPLLDYWSPKPGQPECIVGLRCSRSPCLSFGLCLTGPLRSLRGDRQLHPSRSAAMREARLSRLCTRSQRSGLDQGSPVHTSC